MCGRSLFPRSLSWALLCCAVWWEDTGQSRRKCEAATSLELLANLSAFLLLWPSLRGYCFIYSLGMNTFSLITSHLGSTVTFTQQWKGALLWQGGRAGAELTRQLLLAELVAADRCWHAVLFGNVAAVPLPKSTNLYLTAPSRLLVILPGATN